MHPVGHPQRASGPLSSAPSQRSKPRAHGGYAIALAAAALTAFLSLGAGGSGEAPPPPAVLAAVVPVPVVLPGPATSGPRFVDAFDVDHFRRGNLHTHTNRSDGDSDPHAVYGWYRDHGYDFVIVTDHNRFTNPDDYRSVERPGFIIIGGEEVTMRGAGRQVHVNALCTKSRVPGGKFPTAGEALVHAVGETRGVGGVALINHPNFTWGLGSSDLTVAKGARLLEIESGHPLVHTQGNSSHLSHEALWDASLSQGLDFMGVAVDDAHHLVAKGSRTSVPGRAWVEVFAEKLDEQSVCEALANGELYASTGAGLKRIKVAETSYTVWPRDVGSEVTFVGSGGRELARTSRTSDDGSLSYAIDGSEGYVRARIKNPEGKLAWTPPVRVHPADPETVARSPSDKPAPPG